jgi:ATP-dependent Lon protease
MVRKSLKQKKRKMHNQQPDSSTDSQSSSGTESDPDFNVETYNEDMDPDLYSNLSSEEPEPYDVDANKNNYYNDDIYSETSEFSYVEDEDMNEDIKHTQLLNSQKFNELNEIISKEILSLFNQNHEVDKKKQNEDVPWLIKDMSHEDNKYFSELTSYNQNHFVQKYDSIIKSCPDNNIPILFKIIDSELPDDVKYSLLKKQLSMKKLDPGSGEYVKAKNWIEKLCSIPFNKYIDLPVNNQSQKSDIVEFISNTKKILNEKVYGHLESKDQIIRIIAQWVSNPKSKGNVIGIHGNPGVGKTTLIKDGVCTALGLPFAFIPLGGAGDSSYLEGHSYTYEGSTSGRIVDVLSKAKCMNPIIYFDELDKISNTTRGQEIVNLLIHITDSSQNDQFYDKYFSSIPINLSRCLFIFTYNDVNMINPILKDRMICIHTKDYTTNDKLHIFKNHLFKSVKSDFSLNDITIDDETIKYIISKTQNESGVRNLRRLIENIISNINVEILVGEYMSRDVHIDVKLAAKYTHNIVSNEKNPSLSHIYL